MYSYNHPNTYPPRPSSLIPANSTPGRELAWVRNQVDEANKSGDGGTGTVTVTMDAAELGKRLDSIERSAMGPCDAMLEMFQRCVDVVEGGALPEEVVAMLQGVLRGGEGGGGGGEAGGVLPSSPRSSSLARSVSPAPGEREGGEVGEVGGEVGGEATQAAPGWVFRASKAVDLDTVKQLLGATNSAPVTILARYGGYGGLVVEYSWRDHCYFAHRSSSRGLRTSAPVHATLRTLLTCIHLRPHPSPSPPPPHTHMRTHICTHTHTTPHSQMMDSVQNIFTALNEVPGLQNAVQVSVYIISHTTSILEYSV
jgi:hypothetical protein